jgi:predicted TIM-barrel fold metal-dependent hydrolase
MSSLQEETVSTPGGRDPAVATGIVDCDVHPRSTEPIGALLPYMPSVWAKRLDYLAGKSYAQQFPMFRVIKGHDDGERRDAIPPSGGPTGSDPAFLSVDLLDRYGIDAALLVDLDASSAVQEPVDPQLSAVLASALNDYALDKWSDPRIVFAMVVTPLDPQLAAAEIRRLGSNPRFAGVFLPMSGISMGSAHWYPVYEAAVEAGLPIVCHVSGGEVAGYPAMARFPVAPPASYGETKTLMPLLGQAAVASLVMGGVFERYPELKVLFCEYGFAWAVAHIWRMDDTWRYTRSSTPWMTRWPREVVHDHVYFTSQPLPNLQDMSEIVDMVERYFADNLVFSSDYPHFDQDTPDTILRGISAETRRKIFSDNGRAVLRLPQAAAR